jgi:hypothetical protein
MPVRRSSRRQFLSDVSVLGVSGALWFALGCGVGKRGEEHVTALLEIFSDPDATRIVGEEVLLAAPEWADQRSLTRALLSSPAWDGTDAPGSILADQIRDDFDEDRVLPVRGWWLAETEARLFALVALQES